MRVQLEDGSLPDTQYILHRISQAPKLSEINYNFSSATQSMTFDCGCYLNGLRLSVSIVSFKGRRGGPYISFSTPETQLVIFSVVGLLPNLQTPGERVESPSHGFTLTSVFVSISFLTLVICHSFSLSRTVLIILIASG